MSRLRNPNPKIVSERYCLGASIGSGNFSCVYRTLDIQNGKFYAMKEIRLKNNPQVDSSFLENFKEEVKILRGIQHPNIVKVYDMFEEEDRVYLLLEYMENGSLEKILKQFGKFPENIAKDYVRQVLEGLNQLHSKDITHRDIKAANILVAKDGRLCLTDIIFRKPDNPEVVGSPFWMAPEVIRMESYDGPSVDIWSLGCTTIELLTGKPPYFDREPMNALYLMASEEVPPIPTGISDAASNFLEKCFHKDPTQRPSATELLSHEWLSQIFCG